jgi:hypothetical protein
MPHDTYKLFRSIKTVIVIIGLFVAFVCSGFAQTNQSLASTNEVKIQTKKEVVPNWAKTDLVFTNHASLIIINTNTYPPLHTTDGRIYELMGVDYVEPDGITIKYFERGQFGGIKHVKIDFDDLPKSIQRFFKYDSNKAAEYKSYQAAIQQAQSDAEYEIAKQKYEDAKQQYEDDLREQQIEAQTRIADAQERQAAAL